MKIRDASDKANEILDSAATKAEQAKLTKWLVVAVAVLVLALIAALTF